MLRAVAGLLALAMAVVTAPQGVDAADVVSSAKPVIAKPASVRPVPRSEIVEVPAEFVVPTTTFVPFPGPPSKFHVETQPPPAPYVRYGCRRIWRCDDQVCEWRRGCWGVYGYMEGPYYTIPLARSQWERHGWPSGRSR